MKYSKRLIKEIEKEADIRDHIPGATAGRGAERNVECPECHKKGKGKGLCVKGKSASGKYANTAKCFSCGFNLSGPIAAEQYFGGCDFVAAVERCAATAHIQILPEKTEKKEEDPDRPRAKAGSFAWKQLQASGLKPSDTFARRYDIGGKVVEENIPVFVTGGVNTRWMLTPYDDEMVIRYLDLYGNPVMFARRGAAGKPSPYYRVRYNNPELHIGKNGKPMKYQSPAGSKICFMIPEYIRERYHRKEHIETLFIQEGEKKAEKACLHGIPSLGIQGIYNIGSADGGLIKELQQIIKNCTVKNVVLLLDSDWDHMSENVKIGQSVDGRPRQFAGAVIKFKQYMQTLHTQNISVDVWFGHVNENEAGAKGIDDLLAGPLKGKEEDLLPDMEAAMHTHDGKGVYCDIHKITSRSDFQIQDFWSLTNKDDFFKRHREKLEGIVTFKFQGVRYRQTESGIELDSVNGGVDKFWEIIEEKKKGEEKVSIKVKFRPLECFKFLEGNGFFKVKRGEGDGFDIVRIEDGFVSMTTPMDLRDFVCSYVIRETKSVDVIEYFMNARGTILGSDKLENLKLQSEDIITYAADEQWYFYKNAKIKITADGIEDSGDLVFAWKSVRLEREFERVSIIRDITFSEDSGWHISFSEEAEECEFLQFLCNTSDFWWKPSDAASKDHKKFMQHLVNKITAIGYLLVDYKNKAETKAIAAMDAAMSEVGQNKGRTGKSLIGTALEKMRKVTFINGRNTDASSQFLYNDVTRDTRVIWFDDIKARFDFQRLFTDITGKLRVNVKGGGMYTMNYDTTPKFYITTNHAIEGSSDDDSTKDRICFMSFSDYYNKDHKPTDDFGHLLFDGWDAEQWNLFDNLMLECVMYYIRSCRSDWSRVGCGLIDPPMDDIESRTLRQDIGEAFVQWADIYFCEGSEHLNMRIERKEMFDNFHKEYPGFMKIVTASNFGTKIRKYCEFRKLHFNITKKHRNTGQMLREWMSKNSGKSFIGDMDKSHSKEYFTVCTDEYARSQPF
ncbi:MAG: hypothetical protein K2O24_00900 [Muribaculaceae bacterium]|nr:hypothetical protein [Muribaculaceae bacterium]